MRKHICIFFTGSPRQFNAVVIANDLTALCSWVLTGRSSKVNSSTGNKSYFILTGRKPYYQCSESLPLCSKLPVSSRNAFQQKTQPWWVPPSGLLGGLSSRCNDRSVGEIYGSCPCLCVFCSSALVSSALQHSVVVPNTYSVIVQTKTAFRQLCSLSFCLFQSSQ